MPWYNPSNCRVSSMQNFCMTLHGLKATGTGASPISISPCCIYSPVCFPVHVSQETSICPINSRVHESPLWAQKLICVLCISEGIYIILRYSCSTLKFGLQRLSPGTLFIPDLAWVVFRVLRNIKIKGLWLQMLFGPYVTLKSWILVENLLQHRLAPWHIIFLLFLLSCSSFLEVTVIIRNEGRWRLPPHVGATLILLILPHFKVVCLSAKLFSVVASSADGIYR